MYIMKSDLLLLCLCFFFFKQKTAYEIMPSLVGSEMCIRDRGRRGIYSCAGYHVGSVDLILQILLLRKKDGKEENDDNINRKAE